jgi:hypothetical protein
MGLKSGLDGGRERSSAPAASMIWRTRGPLRLERLSMMTTPTRFSSEIALNLRDIVLIAIVLPGLG